MEICVNTTRDELGLMKRTKGKLYQGIRYRIQSARKRKSE